jgi:hypothetical protein
MKIRAFALALLAAFVAVVAPAMASDFPDNIAGMRPGDDRDYVLEGTVVTVWDDSFLLNDGTGQIVVDIRPYDSYSLDLNGQDYVMVTGRPVDGKLRPLVISRQGAGHVMFSGEAMLEPLPMNEVMRNTTRYRMRETRSFPQTSMSPRPVTNSALASAAPATTSAPPTVEPVNIKADEPNRFGPTTVAPVDAPKPE